MRRIALIAGLILAGTVLAQNVTRVFLFNSAQTETVHLLRLPDGGVRLGSSCEVPIQDGGTPQTWSGEMDLAGAARTQALGVMDSATAKAACRPR